MYYNKRIIALTVTLVLLFAGQVMAQTKVLGFQLGKATYAEVKANLPNGVEVKTEGVSKDGSSGIITDGKGYGIDGLESVGFSFDKKDTLEKVEMGLDERRLNDIKKILASKYRPVHSQYPDAFRLFKANHDYVILYSPWDNTFEVHYMTDIVYRQHMLAICQTEEDKKALERREQKRLEWKRAKEATKF